MRGLKRTSCLCRSDSMHGTTGIGSPQRPIAAGLRVAGGGNYPEKWVGDISEVEVYGNLRVTGERRRSGVVDQIGVNGGAVLVEIIALSLRSNESPARWAIESLDREFFQLWLCLEVRHGAFFQIGKDLKCPAEALTFRALAQVVLDPRPRDDTAGGKSFLCVDAVMHREHDLLHLVGALRAACGLASGLNRRQQQGHQNPDDGNDDQQLDQSKTV